MTYAKIALTYIYSGKARITCPTSASQCVSPSLVSCTQQLIDRSSQHPDILFAVAIMTASIFYDFTAANRLQAAIAVSNTSVSTALR